MITSMPITPVGVSSFQRRTRLRFIHWNSTNKLLVHLFHIFLTSYPYYEKVEKETQRSRKKYKNPYTWLKSCARGWYLCQYRHLMESLCIVLIVTRSSASNMTPVNTKKKNILINSNSIRGLFLCINYKSITQRDYQLR